METLREIAKKFFNDKGWSVDESPDGSFLRMGFVGRNGRWPCYVELNEDLGQVVFFSLHFPEIPQAQRKAVAEYLMRVNCGLNVGSFEINLDDGMVRLRSGLDVDGQGLTTQLMNNLVVVNVAVMDKYLPGLEAVLKGESPVQALAKVAR